MAITVAELPNSRSWNMDGSITLRYIIRGSDNDYLIREALLAALPATYQDRMLYDRPLVEPVPGAIDTVDGTGIWRAEATYKLPSTLDAPDPYAIGAIRLTVETTGGTMHRSASIETVGFYSAAQGGPPDYEGAIGVTSSGVQGVDVPMAVFNLRAEKAWDPATPPDLGVIYRLSAKVNNAQFTVTDGGTGMAVTFEKGELLFRGGSLGGQRGDGGIPVTYLFEATPNATGLSVGRMTGISMEGWQYLWARYKEEDDAGASEVVPRPLHAYVEQVLEYGDFSALGL